MKAKANSRRGAAKLDTLRLQFDSLLARMQTMKVRAGLKAAFDAPPPPADLIEDVRRAMASPSAEAAVIEKVFENIIASLNKRGKIEIRGFGRFRTRRRAKRIGRKSGTTKKRNVTFERVPIFEPSRQLRKSLNRQKDGSSSVSEQA